MAPKKTTTKKEAAPAVETKIEEAVKTTPAAEAPKAEAPKAEKKPAAKKPAAKKTAEKPAAKVAEKKAAAPKAEKKPAAKAAEKKAAAPKAEKKPAAKKPAAKKAPKKLGKIWFQIEGGENAEKFDYKSIEKKAAKIGGTVYVVLSEKMIYNDSGDKIAF